MTQIDQLKRNMLFASATLVAAGCATDTALAASAAPARSAADDREAIGSLVRMERYHRDQHQFDALAKCYVPDSRVRVSWFSGTGAEFAEASRKTAESGFVSFHQINPMRIELNGDRALCESYGTIICPGASVNGTLMTLVSYSRFLSCVRRTPEGWRLVTFDCIYQGDFLTPVKQGETISLDVDVRPGARWSYRSLAAMGKASGHDINTELAGIDRPDLVKQLMDETETWLATGRLV